MGVVIQVAEFKEKIEKGRGKVDESLTIEQQVIIKEGDFNIEFFYFKGINFRKGLLFDNSGDIKVGVKLVNCSGSKFFMSGCKVTNVSDAFDFPKGAGLILDQCKFKEIAIVGNPEFDREVLIRNKCEIGALEVESCGFESASVSIEDSKISDKCDFTGVKTNLGVRFHKTEVDVKIRISNLIGGFSITDSQINKDTHIYGLEGNLTFNNAMFKDNLYIKDVRIGQFTSSGDYFKKGLELTVNDQQFSGSLNKVYIQNTETGEGMSFDGWNVALEELKIPTTNLLKGTLKFFRFTNLSLFLEGINSNASVSFKTCRFKEILIRDFYNQAGLSFTFCFGEEDSVFRIDGSDIGTTSFLNVDFRTFKNIDIRNSIISKAFFIGGRLFEPHQIATQSQELIDMDHPGIEPIHLENQHKRKREIYKQLRHAVANEGDSISAIELRAQELKLYRQELKASKNHWKERAILWLSLSNDMGLNWVKPLVLIFLITIPFFVFSVSSYSPDLIWMNPVDLCSVHWGRTWDTYADYGGYFWSMFNPIRNLKHIIEPTNGHLSGWVYFWDGFHRIVLAFFIFQIITAFRKYIK